MEALCALLFSALVLKDTTALPYEQYLRLIAQVTTGAAGGLWLLHNRQKVRPARYWLIYVYLAVLTASALVATRPAWVALQVLSLACVCFFFIAAVERAQDPATLQRFVFAVVGGAFAMACLASLMLYAVEPVRAIDTTVDSWRFKGVFGKPGLLAVGAGLLLLIAAFERWHPALRLGGATLGAINMALSGSRSAMLAAVISLGVGLLTFSPRRWLWSWSALSASLFLLYVGATADVAVPSWLLEAVRIDSIDTLSGRTDMWSLGLQVLGDSPFLGYGFTAGSDGFASLRTQIIDEFGQFSSLVKQGGLVDSGFIQSLMDTGVIGFGIYLSIILVSLHTAFRQDDRQSAPATLGCLMFLTIANFGESLIFAAATTHSVFFWFIAIFLSRKRGSG